MTPNGVLIDLLLRENYRPYAPGSTVYYSMLDAAWFEELIYPKRSDYSSDEAFNDAYKKAEAAYGAKGAFHEPEAARFAATQKALDTKARKPRAGTPSSAAKAATPISGTPAEAAKFQI